jgi:tetratricopeptide (TPR) repeat protein
MTRGWKAAAVFIAAMTPFAAAPANAGGLKVSPEVRQALDTLYAGDVQSAIAVAQKIQSRDPENPVGFLLESEALWWVRYCNGIEIKYGMVEAWKHSKDPNDDRLLRLADKAIETADSFLARQDTAEMRFYKGMGWVLKVRVYGVRGDNRLAARAAVNGRAEMIRALELDPDLADATAMLGLYNYYVSTLSPIVKILRFFMGIPGGDKDTGVKQMETGMTRGVLLNVDVRFILARALRQYDQKYAEALQIAEPLVARYPYNPNFLLLLGNLNAELGRNPKASEYFHAVLNLSSGSACAAHCRDLANSFLASLH